MEGASNLKTLSEGRANVENSSLEPSNPVVTITFLKQQVRILSLSFMIIKLHQLFNISMIYMK
jgi:hypothetical protein